MRDALIFDERAFRIELARQGYRNVSALARDLGVDPCHLNRVAKGMVPGPGLRERVAQALKVRADLLWREPAAGAVA